MSDFYDGQLADMEGRIMARLEAIEVSGEAALRQAGQNNATLTAMTGILRRMEEAEVKTIRLLCGAVVLSALGQEGLRILAKWMGV